MMTATLLYHDRPAHAVANGVPGDDLWLSPADLGSATGWEIKPQGWCRGETCVPIPPALQARLSDGNHVNLSAFAAYLGEPVVHDDATQTWLVGVSAASRRAALLSLEAPNFTLPDLDGNLHALADYHGKKVLLLSWASW